MGSSPGCDVYQHICRASALSTGMFELMTKKVRP
jgi:hypothetical protein